MKLYLFGFIATAIAFTSCKKDHDNSNSGIAMQLKASNTSVPLANTPSGTTAESLRTLSVSIEWTAGTASANLLKFEAKQSGKEIEFKSSVQQTIDVFGSNSTLGNISVPAGTYDEIEFKAQLNSVGTSPALELKGNFTGNSTVIPVVFRATESIILKGEKHNVTINSGTIHNAVTTMDLRKVMQDIRSTDLENAVRTNGEILITSATNKSLYDIIVKNLRHLEDEEEWH
jgi:hypothetical protein